MLWIFLKQFLDWRTRFSSSHEGRVVCWRKSEEKKVVLRLSCQQTVSSAQQVQLKEKSKTISGESSHSTLICHVARMSYMPIKPQYFSVYERRSEFEICRSYITRTQNFLVQTSKQNCRDWILHNRNKNEKRTYKQHDYGSSSWYSMDFAHANPKYGYSIPESVDYRMNTINWWIIIIMLVYWNCQKNRCLFQGLK